ncbi:MAG: hypothetical protein V4649_04215 [Bacteroidota bacterium]
MKSPFAKLFLEVQEQIKREVPAVAHIDQDLGQLSRSRPPVSWPCVLVDFENFRFKNLGENVQTAKGTVVLRLAFAPHSNTTAATPAPYKEQALSYYDIEWHLHKALHGWTPGDEYGSMVRTSAITQDRADSYRVRELRYKIAFDDYSTKRELLYTRAAIVVQNEIEL